MAGQGRGNAVEAALDGAAAACARGGGQFTELRRTVLRLILESDGPQTAYQLLDRLREVRAGAAPPAVYRALDFLLAHRLVHRVERLNAFVACVDAAHPHPHAVQFLICNRCGRVVEIEDRGVADALAGAAERQGFRPGHAVVEVDGTCSACAGRG